MGKIEVSRAARNFRNVSQKEKERRGGGGEGERERETATVVAAHPTPYHISIAGHGGSGWCPWSAAKRPSSRRAVRISSPLASTVLRRHVSQINRPPSNGPLPTTEAAQTQGCFRSDAAIDVGVLGLSLGTQYLWIAGDASH
jgi:hypothetical protein